MRRLYRDLINKTLSFSNWRQHLPRHQLNDFFLKINKSSWLWRHPDRSVCVFFLHFCGPCLPLAWKCLKFYCHIVMFSRQKDLCFRWLQWLLAAKRVRRMFPWDVRMLQETVVISLVERCWDRRFGGSICFMFGIVWFTLDSETPENQSVLLHQKPAQLAYLQTYTRIYLCVVLLILVVWLCV